MDILLNHKISIEQNAAVYFEKAKKARKKTEGVRKTIERFKEELKNIDEEEIREQIIERQKINRGPLEWFEKFRWFVSSDGFLCIGGRDATSNDIIIKKHSEKGDIVFHTSMPGSPFFIVKSHGEKIPETTLKETAIATAAFSRAWREGFASVEVYHINPEQVLKSDPSGISLPRGSFYIDGKKTFYHPEIILAIGKTGELPSFVTPSRMIMCGPPTVIQKWCTKVYTINQGDKKASDIAKKISKEYNEKVDDIIRIMPSGEVSLKRM